MTWVPLLLTDPSPCLRWLVLRELLHYPDEAPEVAELAEARLSDPRLTSILSLQEPDGSWEGGGLAEGRTGGSRILSTAFAMARLAFLGFDRTLPSVQRAAGYLFAQQQEDGSWPLARNADEIEPDEAPKREGYSMIPLQTAFPLRGLAACGYASDPRCERAYDWLLAQRLADGAWPTGMASGVFGYVAGYRRLPHSRWGCRSNTTGALLCLSLHQERRHSQPAQRALDLLLGRETREKQLFGYEVARFLGAERARGFITFFARFDLALILSLCSRMGVSTSDARLEELVKFILSMQGEYGLWEYPSRPQVSRWLTFDIMRSLASLDESLDWVNLEPRSPFQPYPKREKRF